jgi:hypothetical protein
MSSRPRAWATARLVEALFDRVEDDRLNGVGDVLIADAVPLAGLQRRHEARAGNVLDDDRRLTDDLLAVVQHRDRRRWPQLGQLGAVEIALLLEDVVGDALLVERDENLLTVEREGMLVEGEHRSFVRYRLVQADHKAVSGSPSIGGRIRSAAIT